MAGQPADRIRRSVDNDARFRGDGANQFFAGRQIFEADGRGGRFDDDASLDNAVRQPPFLFRFVELDLRDETARVEEPIFLRVRIGERGAGCENGEQKRARLE